MTTLNALIAGFLMQMPPIVLPPIPQAQYVPAPAPQQYVAPNSYYRYQGPPPQQHQPMSEDQERARIMAEARAFCSRYPNNEACGPHQPGAPQQ
jgi:hypothetical protein